MRTITSLSKAIEDLSEEERLVFHSIFSVESETTHTSIPEALKARVQGWFALPGDESPKDALQRAETQVVIRVHNKVTHEHTLFNSVRALKPAPTVSANSDADMDELIFKNKLDGTCDFCEPAERTATERWGRVDSAYTITAANIARGEAHHGLCILKEHHPLRFGLDVVADILATFNKWKLRTTENIMKPDPKIPQESIRPIPTCATLMWNCMPKSGASQPHGHAQMVLTRDYLGKANALRSCTAAYTSVAGLQGVTEYMFQWVRAHNSLGLVRHLSGGMAVVTTITPLKEREMILVAPAGCAVTDHDFARALSSVLRYLVDACKTRAFNVSVYTPPDPCSGSKEWEVLPLMARVVDRGPLTGASDVASFEMFGTPLVASDPFVVMNNFNKYMDEHKDLIQMKKRKEREEDDDAVYK